MLLFIHVDHQASASNNAGQAMEQVYIFKHEPLETGVVIEVKLGGFAYDSRDVHVLFTGDKSLTNQHVVSTVVNGHYIPWMKHVRQSRTGDDKAVMVSLQDSDPDQFAILNKNMRTVFMEANTRVRAVDLCCLLFIGILGRELVSLADRSRTR